MENKINKDLVQRKSEISGKGLFALRDFSKGEKIYSYKKGRIVKVEDIEKLTKEESEHLDKIGGGQYEIILPPACYINHSCEPNVMEEGRTGYAIRDIKNGEELTVDYDKIAHLDYPITCRCHSKNCRKVIRGAGAGKYKRT
jgi:SET domain-containing protein